MFDSMICWICFKNVHVSKRVKRGCYSVLVYHKHRHNGVPCEGSRQAVRKANKTEQAI
jgi:hypothetical protein